MSAGRVEAKPAGQKAAEAAPAAQAATNPVVEKLAAAAQATTSADIGLKFQVNDETNEVTIFVIDRASKQVLRTIPPEEMKNLSAGDLLELFV